MQRLALALVLTAAGCKFQPGGTTVTAAGTYRATATQNTSIRWIMRVVAFKGVN